MGRTSKTKSNGFFPTPTASMGSGPSRNGREGGMNLQTAVASLSLSRHSNPGMWVGEDGTDYREAVARWEEVLGRPAPDPTEPSERAKNGRRLNTVFVEWMMGVPEGWVTDSSLNRQAQLKMLGAGVVPLQGEMAIRMLVESFEDGEERAA